jgi:hypothetical protein
MTPTTVFYTYDSGKITFNPTDTALITSSPYTVTVKITDGMDSPEYTFKVTVKHALPYLKTSLTDQTVKIGEKKDYSLPVFNPASNDANGITAI